MKRRIAVYHYRYLPLSETFIYRQLLGLGRFYDVALLTHGLENHEEFPGIRPQVLLPRSIWGRMTRREDRYFDKFLEGVSLFHVNFGHIAMGLQRHAFRAGIPMTAYFLGVDASACLKSGLFRFRLRRSSFTAVFTNSEDMKKRLTPFLPEGMKCHVVYCGIPLEKFPFRQRDSVPEGALFLQVSRLDYKKGVDVTIRAFSRYVRETDPTARLVIAGDGPLAEPLKRLKNDLGLQDRVTFLGHVNYTQYLRLLGSADVFVHPSVTAHDGDMEGLPNAVCEAMASGLPVISTRHSGIPEAVEDGKNGFLAEERDVDGLFEKMAFLRNADIGAISKNARVTIEEKFDYEKTSALLADHMRSIISGRFS